LFQQRDPKIFRLVLLLYLDDKIALFLVSSLVNAPTSHFNARRRYLLLPTIVYTRTSVGVRRETTPMRKDHLCARRFFEVGSRDHRTERSCKRDVAL